MPLVLVGLCLSNIKIEHGHPPPNPPPNYFHVSHIWFWFVCGVGTSSLSVFWQDTEEDLSVLEGALQIHRRSLTDRKWSVIVPTMNEEENIVTTLQTVCQVKNEWVKGRGLHDKRMGEGLMNKWVKDWRKMVYYVDLMASR